MKYMVIPFISSLLSRYNRRFKNMQNLSSRNVCTYIYAHTYTFVCIYISNHRIIIHTIRAIPEMKIFIGGVETLTKVLNSQKISLPFLCMTKM